MAVRTRSFFLSIFILAGLVGIAAAGGACVSDQEVPSEFLVAFEQPTPGDDETADASGGHEHREMPPGAGANAAMVGTAEESEKGGATHTEVAGTPEAHVHVEMPPGGMDGDGGSATPQPHAHVDAPPGYGSNLPPAGTPAATDAVPVAGTPEPHPHVERPPGYGSHLPPEGAAAESEPEPDPVVGEPEPVEGEPEPVVPKQETPFEREYKGKEMITVSGEIIYDGEVADGVGVDLDCFVPLPNTRARRKLVNKVKLPGPGPYTMKVPAGFGKLIVTAFIDLERDGPDPKDPQGAYQGNPLEIKDKDITGIDLVLKPKVASR